MPAASIVIDLPANAAAIPGSGDVPVVFTHSLDIARFTVALLTLPKWDKASYIIGDKITWNRFLKIAAEAKGTKFDISYDPAEKLKMGEVTELPTHRSVYPFYPKANLQIMMSGTGLLTEQGFFDLKPARSLNHIFPEIRPRSVRELVEVAWGGNEVRKESGVLMMIEHLPANAIITLSMALRGRLKGFTFRDKHIQYRYERQTGSMNFHRTTRKTPCHQRVPEISFRFTSFFMILRTFHVSSPATEIDSMRIPMALLGHYKPPDPLD